MESGVTNDVAEPVIGPETLIAALEQIRDWPGTVDNRQVLPPTGRFLPSSTPYSFTSTSFTIRPELHPPGQFTPLVLTAPPTGVVHSAAGVVSGNRSASDQQSGGIRVDSGGVRQGATPARSGGGNAGSVLLHINEIEDWNSQCVEENVEIYVMEKPDKKKPKPKRISITDTDYLFRRRKPRVKQTKIQKQFICHICAHESKRQAELVTHLRIHTGEKPHHCPFCEKRFARQDYLNNHIRVHTGEKPFACPICQRSFAIKVNLNKHLLIHSSRKPLQCIDCPATFRRRSQLRQHSRTHEKDGFQACPVCKKKLKGDVRKHIARVHKNTDILVEESECVDEVQVVESETPDLVDALSVDVRESRCHCDHCGKTFNSRIELMEHIDDYLESVRRGNESSLESIRLENDESGAVVEQPVVANDRVVSETVVVIETDDVTCPLQEQTGGKERSSHLADTAGLPIVQENFLVIDETAPFSAPPVRESSATVPSDPREERPETNALEHVREIEVVVSPSVMAEVTEALRNQTSHFGVPRSETDSPEERVGSELVDEEGDDESTPATSVPIYIVPAERRSYPPPPLPEMAYRCADCGLEFARKFNYSVHRRIHTGQKPYTCETCAKQFKDRTNYNRHVRIHTGEKPYKCEQCDSAFTRNSHLQNHVRKHRNERQFACEQCGRDFNYYTALVNHMRTHSGEQRRHRCRFCDRTFSTPKERGSHMKATHAELRCEECQISFTSVGNLKLHDEKKHAIVSRETGLASCDDSMRGLDEILEDVE